MFQDVIENLGSYQSWIINFTNKDKINFFFDDLK